MSENIFGDRMQEAIRGRMENALWDRKIASAVLAKRRRRNVIRLTAGASGLGIVLILLLAFVLPLDRNPGNNELSSFITLQIEKTYDAVFSGQVSGSNGAGTRTYIMTDLYYNSTDSLIEGVLSER